MGLSNFFRLNMPFAVDFYDDGSIVCYNREYYTLGSADQTIPGRVLRFKFDPKKKMDFIKKIAVKGEVNRMESRYRIFLYSDATNPSDGPRAQDRFWQDYSDRLKLLSDIQLIR